MQNKNRIEMIVFDMDGTIVQYDNRFKSSWHALFDAYGMGEIVTKLEDENYLKKGKCRKCHIRIAGLWEK